MKSKYGGNETIKIEATMFDGSAVVLKSGDGSAAESVSLHVSLLVDISKGSGHDLEYVCSAWPDHIEIQKVYIFNREKSFSHPYMGHSFRDLDTKLRNGLAEFLKERGVNGDLSVFLHEFMMNKDRIELINWLRTVKSFVKK